MQISHYEEIEGLSYWGASERKQANLVYLEDNARRYNQFSRIIANKVWLDVGTGSGGMLDLFNPIARQVIAVEPQRAARMALVESGYAAYRLVPDVPDNNIDVVSLFHVLEHLTEPIQTLEEIRSKMKKGGKIIVEVPHAEDFLISFLALDSFKAATFWSEHLLLHTRSSLTRFLEVAGFTNIRISGFQRYPLANHLFWLARNRPGGHIQWSELRSPELDIAYSSMLNTLNKTDTLIAVADA
jgi:SAM-dependent methyltransferase